jgi:hypothetical protein
MSNNNMKTVSINKENLELVFDDLDFLSRLMDDMISDMHNVKGGQQTRHSYMLYREYMWRMKSNLQKGIQTEVTNE